ncbi:MAG: hypothetical protein Q3983_07645 [Capnocytophaga sp.]|nr:hypothetical protein [Capnocytophaga sp.]
MKKISVFLVSMLFPLCGKAQSYYKFVYNPRILAQIGANAGIRLGNAEIIHNSFKHQTGLYEESRNDMLQVNTIHGYIYNNLYNINSLLSSGKQIEGITYYAKEIVKNYNKLRQISRANPMTTIWLKKLHENLVKKSISLKNELSTIINKNKELLMDGHDREELIDNIHTKLREINIDILSIINLIEFNKSRPYIYSIPVLGNFVQQDKQLVQDIIQKYRNFKYY